MIAGETSMGLKDKTLFLHYDNKESCRGAHFSMVGLKMNA